MINAQNSLKYSSSVRIALEMLTVKLTRRESIVSLAEILKRIAALEKTTDSAENSTLQQPQQIQQPQKTQQTKQQTKIPDTKAKTADPASLYKLREIWPAAIKKAKTEKMYVGSCFEEAEIVEFADGILTLGYAKSNKFHKEIIERPQNKKLIEDIISELINSRLMIECIISKDINPATGDDKQTQDPANKEQIRPQAIRKDAMKKVLSDPIIQSALDIFDGNIMKFM